MFISYAQNFEDVMLWRALGHVEAGFYIDIGAQDPIVDSVSLAFYQKGWHGIHVEPTLHYAELLREQRPGDVVIQAAVGERASVTTLYEIPETGLSTLDPAIAAKHSKHGFTVQKSTTSVMPLAAILEACPSRDIHWLKIDVEGFELQVLQGWGNCTARPWIVVVESTVPMSQDASEAAWEPLLETRGYRFVYFDGLNRYYVSHEHPELSQAFLAPPNVFDAFAINGTASTDLHRLITGRHENQLIELRESHQKSADIAHETIEALRADNALERADLLERLSSEQQALAEFERGSEQREGQLRQELADARQSLLVQAQERANREQAVSNEMLALHRDAAANLASLELEHRDRADARHRDHAAERAVSEEMQSERERRIVDQGRRCEDLLREQMEQATRYAQQLADELNNLEQSWAWRLAHAFGGYKSRTRRLPSFGTQRTQADSSLSTLTPDASAMTDNSHSAQTVASVDDLLALHDTVFVRSAYLTILGRPVDPTGLSGMLEQLRSGADKEQMLTALAASAEGKVSAAAASLPGLQQLVDRAQRSRPSLPRRILQRGLLALLRPLSNQIRATDARLLEFCNSSQARFDRLDAAVAALGQLSSPGSSLSSDERAALNQTSLHGREIYFKLKDAAAQKARLAMS